MAENSLNSHGDEELYQPPSAVQEVAHVKSLQQYQQMHKESLEDPVSFWGRLAKELIYWKSFPTTTDNFMNFNFDPTKGPISIKWMEGGVTNVCYSVLDRNVEKGLGDTVAFYWEGNDPYDNGKITYSELLTKVCQMSNILKNKGVQKGDRVAIYMPMILDLCVTMLACARIGAVHSIVFAGFSSSSLANRILDAKCKVLVTADGVWRGTKLLNLKEIADGALQQCEDKGHPVEICIVVRHLLPAEEEIVPDSLPAEQEVAKRPYKIQGLHWKTGRDVWYHEEMKEASTECEPEWMDAEDPLFMLYTSGSTGKPKGVVHTQAGYLLYSATTFKYVFDYHPGEIYWCTADVGWITGHTYVVYGPMANGATSIIFEGTPLYPDAGRLWEVVDKYKVSKFYTAPTAIRTLMKFGDQYVKKHSRASLKVLGTVGEPINPEAWLWYYKVIGNSKCAIVDTFWQTETGGHVITPLPGATPTKPGSATFPFFGIQPVILSEEGKEVEGEAEGYLVFKRPWPGIMRTVFGNHERFETTYFKKFPGYYCTGDGAKRDKDGYIWITGRIDDMLNVSGHLLSTAEIESVLVEHELVAEAAVVAHPHEIKGECTYCFVTLVDGAKYGPEIEKKLIQKVRTQIGPFAQPEYMQEAPGLPKTRSGKIMRRVLRKIAVGDRELGDVSTMADPAIVDVLFKLRPEKA